MTVCLAYIAVTHGPITEEYVARFAATYAEYPPGFEHDTLIICNGGPLALSTTLMFNGLGGRMLVRGNDAGWDIAGYIEAARGPCKDYDMMFCVGESNYFHRAGWLARLVQAWERHGPGMYGPYSSNAVRSHLNTTAFCCPPLALAQYPARVHDKGSRYEFEHGSQCFWRRVAQRGMPVKLVTWDGEWEPRLWRMPRNILWRGDQSNCLMWCNHTDIWQNHSERTRSYFSKFADSPYR